MSARDGKTKPTFARLLGGAALAAALAGGVGCRNLDDFSIMKMNFEVFERPSEPVQVIRTSKDGAARARAFAELREPLAHGGSQKDQDVFVALLCHSAAHETDPSCRIAAIESLRTYKDKRAVGGLKDAYYKASTMQPETANIIRLQALTALGESKQPEAMEIIVKVLREPPSDGADADRQQKLDERIAAARALGNFKEYQATAVLVEILRTEKDVALRHRAHESLIAATGKDIPEDATAWGDFLMAPEKSTAPDYRPKVGEELLKLTGFR